MEYTIAFNQEYIDLIKDVNEAIKNGWRPQGGLAILYQGKHTFFAQAMIRGQ